MTELDLRHSLIPDELVDELTRTMPAHAGPQLEEDRELAKFDYVRFMEGLLGGGEGGSSSSSPVLNGRHSPTKTRRAGEYVMRAGA